MSKFKNTEELEKAEETINFLQKQFNEKGILEEQIDGLKQQLAEWQDGTIICKWTDAENKIKELEQQLAEKDKSEKQFKTMYFNKCLDYEHLHEKFDDKCAEFELKEYDYKQTIFEKNQDKISFCIEKFQETKKSLRDKVCLMENDEHCYPQNAIHWQDVVAIIDNQIATLKKGVE